MDSMDFEQARFNMVEQQVRPWNVYDPRVLEVISRIPREDFVPDEYRNLAYADICIPLSDETYGSSMLHPNIEGRILQNLNVDVDDVVLEIGTGTGYLTACLAALARHVDSVESNPELYELAKKNLVAHDIDNVSITNGDACKDWNQKQFYDAIAITGSMPEIPEAYKKKLQVGGRLFVITGEAPAMTAQLLTRIGKNEWTTENLFETSVSRLCSSQDARGFEF